MKKFFYHFLFLNILLISPFSFSYGMDCSAYDDLISNIESQISSLKMKALNEYAARNNSSVNVYSAYTETQITQAVYNSKYGNEMKSLQKEYDNALAKKSDCLTNIDINNKYTNTDYSDITNNSTNNSQYNKYKKKFEYYYELGKDEDTKNAIEYNLEALEALKKAKKYAPSKDYDIIENLERGLTAIIGADYCSINDYENGIKYLNYSLLIKEDSKIEGYLERCKEKQKKSTEITEVKNTINSGETGTAINCENPSRFDKSHYITEAINWMYENGMTKYNDWEGFRPNYNITREEASKFFVVFYKNEFKKSLIANPDNPFKDIENADPSLKHYILNANFFGLIKGFNGNFMPFDQIKQSQVLAILVRMYKGNHDVNSSLWYQDYIDIAKNDGLLCGIEIFKDPDYYNESRGDIAIMLYNLHKYLNN